jgi:hypothetical protein
MSNLTDLLPAGAGGKQVDFVASGTIGNGVTVGLNSDGTVTAVASASQSLGSPVTFSSGSIQYSTTTASFDASQGKVVIAYKDTANSNYGTAVVGTVSGTSISFGTPVVFESNTSDQFASCYDANGQKTVISYRASSNGKSIVGTVSGTSISFGSSSTFSATSARYMSSSYDISNQKICIGYRDGSTNYGSAVVGTVSGSSISFGTVTVFNSAQTSGISTAYDSDNVKIILSYNDSANGSSIAGDISGTSISFGTKTVFYTSPPAADAGVSSAYDTNAKKLVVTYSDILVDETGMAIVGTISGSAISFGTAVTYSGGKAFGTVVYDEAGQKVVIQYKDDSPSYGKLVVGTVSGTSISFGSVVTFESAQIGNPPSATYDSSNRKVVIAYYDVGNSNRGTSVVFQTNSTNYTSFIGISDAAISSAASGSVTIKGGISSNVTGLTANSTYYVQTNGTLSTTVSSVLAGKALSSTSINLDYTT